ncbi:hypothetical protein Bdiaspc4_21545 [Bradyrhizobium diazoefficiens]|nr:hypothetical protein CO678_14640 [Bradyrhizobium diazoefficiens]QBP22925.1 hypothetical protein Bdiaspc4_21545 [Bradyrhizobium diazoefficiens]QHP70800.1 hypothetical protein EI171_28055 [Bradyrhizobium sp. LCT2]
MGRALLISPASLRAKRSNPERLCGRILDCFVARAPRDDGWAGTVLTSPRSRPDIPAGAIPRLRSPPR